MPSFIAFLRCLLQLTVVQGDIVQINADAVVHPTGGSCSFGGEVGKTIQQIN